MITVATFHLTWARHHPLVGKRIVSFFRLDQMVRDNQIKHVSRINELLGQFNIGLARRQVSGGMIMGKDNAGCPCLQRRRKDNLRIGDTTGNPACRYLCDPDAGVTTVEQ